jgi:hypothetical protein
MNLAILSGILMFAASAIPETAQFTIYQNGKKIGVEEFTISAHGGGYLAEGRTEMMGDPTPITSRMELDEKLNPTSYEYQRGDGAINVKFAKPTSEYETTSGGKQSTIDFRFPDGGFVVDNNFFHHVLLLLYKAGVNGGAIPIFVPQDMRLGEAKIQPKGNGVYQLLLGAVKLEATTDAAGKLIRLSVPDAKVLVER